MVETREELSIKEKNALDIQLSTTFGKVLDVNQELKDAKKLGDKAKEMAEGVKSGVFQRKQAIEDLKEASKNNADGNLKTLEIVKKLADNQRKLADTCKEFIRLGMVDLASNRAVVKYIKDVMSGGADKSLNEETVEQLKGVIRELKQKEDLLLKQRRQGDRINEHEKRIATIEIRTKSIDEEIEDSKAYDKKQDEEIDKLYRKNDEQDERLVAGDKYDKLQDERLEKGEAKDVEQDKMLAVQIETDARHDQTLAIHNNQIEELQRQIESMERDIAVLEEGRRLKAYIALCGGIGLVGVILGIISMLL